MNDDEKDFVGEWTYGKTFSLSAKILMKYIYECLG